MKTVYFNGVSNHEDLKKAYRKQAKKLHPDMSTGNEAEFVKLQDEYEKLFEYLKTHSTVKADTNSNEVAKSYTDIINNIVNLNVDIEIIGTWVWVSGNTYSCKETLKKNGFKFSRKRKMWYYTSTPYKKRSKKRISTDEMRSYFGSEKVSTQRQKALA